jgi:hypothetical protein
MVVSRQKPGLQGGLKRFTDLKMSDKNQLNNS